jgi:hypothetical protein
MRPEVNVRPEAWKNNQPISLVLKNNVGTSSIGFPKGLPGTIIGPL